MSNTTSYPTIVSKWPPSMRRIAIRKYKATWLVRLFLETKEAVASFHHRTTTVTTLPSGQVKMIISRWRKVYRCDKPSQVVTKTIFLLQDSLTWKATVVVARVVLVPAEQSVAERRFPDSGLSQQDDGHHLAFRDRQNRREGQDKSELSTPGHPDVTDAAKFFGTDAFSNKVLF